MYSILKRKKMEQLDNKDGGLEKCPLVCAVAARLAAEIILDLQKGR